MSSPTHSTTSLPKKHTSLTSSKHSSVNSKHSSVGSNGSGLHYSNSVRSISSSGNSPLAPRNLVPPTSGSSNGLYAQDGLVPQRQAPPPPRPSLQLAPGSASYGSSSSPPEREALPQRASLKASKKGPPPPEKPSRQHNQDSLRSNYSDTTLTNSSPKSSYRSHHYDSSSDYTSSSSNRSTFKGVFSNIVSSMSDLLSSDKKMEISSPYNPVHLTHVGYNLDTGEFTGLPKEWQQLLQESGISKQDQAANPQAVIDVIGFYTDSQEGKQNDAVWKKFGHNAEAKSPKSGSKPPRIDKPSSSGKTVFENPRVPPAPAKKPSVPHPADLAPSAKVENLEKIDTDSSPVSPPVTTPSTSSTAPRLPPPKPKKPQHPGPTVPSKQPTVVPLTVTHAPSQQQPQPKRREKKAEKETVSSQDVIRRLQAICTDADPTKLYRSLVKIGQGASGGVYTAYQVGTNLSVAIKQMNLEQQPKKDLIINEILVMKESSHKNIVNYIDSFLYRGDLWVVMEYMEGGSLTEVVTTNEMGDPQIGAVCRETLLGLEHLHSKGVIHRDIKSDNVLLALNGDIKL
ncbi:signal transducing kinase of the PAK, partial [Haplosporangium bisporale]